jgi:hypothetical protein
MWGQGLAEGWCGVAEAGEEAFLAVMMLRARIAWVVKKSFQHEESERCAAQLTGVFLGASAALDGTGPADANTVAGDPDAFNVMLGFLDTEITGFSMHQRSPTRRSRHNGLGRCTRPVRYSGRIMSDLNETGDRSITHRIAALEIRESNLLRKLEQCVPPVDQHRYELERVRTELESARTAERWSRSMAHTADMFGWPPTVAARLADSVQLVPAVCRNPLSCASPKNRGTP